jgi:LysM repeat protein
MLVLVSRAYWGGSGLFWQAHQEEDKMRHISWSRIRPIAAAGLVLLAVVIAGCTRSRATDVAPTTAPGESVDATFQAVLAATQTAIALAPPGSGGGDELTATPSQPAAAPTAVPSATPLPPTPIPPTVAPTVAGPTQYTVKPGDWLYKIAREHGVDVNALIAANPGINPNNIQPGQVLNIPAPGAPAPAPSGPTTYVVQPGEWIYQIARKLGKDPKAIIAANPSINPNLVYPGTVLTIP